VQLVHVVEAGALEKVPGAHATQVLASVAIVAVEKVPGLQSVHTVWPSVSAYVPGPQLRHVVCPGVGLYVPRLHREQLAREVAPLRVEKVPAGQLVHVEDALAPYTSEYFPGAQSIQATDDTWPGSVE
jgi:hypothetical protein